MNEVTWTGECADVGKVKKESVRSGDPPKSALPCRRYPMAMGTLADLEDQDPMPGKESPLEIHLKVKDA